MDCYFCRKNIKTIDHKAINTLRSYISASGKIKNRAKTGLCATHQREINRAVKRLRNLGALSPNSKY